MERPKGHGDYANLLNRLWPAGSELRQVAEELEDLERQPGYARLQAVLDVRERLLLDRLVEGEPGEIRGTDQLLGMIAGLRQAQRAIASVYYEAEQSRERDAAKARAADAEGAP
jgi:hypothetical protein